VTILPPKPGTKDEPVDQSLVTSLIHPDRQGGVVAVQFSPDGSLLYGFSRLSGIVQIWDVISKKETRRIDTPPRTRGNPATPDWKTLYVAVQKETIIPLERGGNNRRRFEYAGEIRAYDMLTGREKAPLRSPPAAAPEYVMVSPDRRFLIYGEDHDFEAPAPPANATFALDLRTGKTWKLCDGVAYPAFAPDGKTIATDITNYRAHQSAVVLIDLASGKELAKRTCPESDRYFLSHWFAPDGKVVAVFVWGKRGGPLEVRFLDGKTLEERGKLVAKGDPQRAGQGMGQFTPDSKRFIALDHFGNVLIWNMAAQKLERTVPLGARDQRSFMVMSPDSKTVVVAWMPKVAERDLDADPEDLPQPRLSLVDLEHDVPPKVLIAPHGRVGALALSPDGNLLAFSGIGVVHLFDLRSTRSARLK
jgi:WD40 repeat protein